MEDYRGMDGDNSTSTFNQSRKEEERLKDLLTQLFEISQNDLWEASVAIHDRILQLLNIAHLEVGTYIKGAEKDGQLTLDPAQLTELKDKITASIEESHKLMLEISSPILKYFGLSAALESLAEEKRNQRKSTIVLECNNSVVEISDHIAQLSLSIINGLVVLAESHFESPEIRIQINYSSESLLISINCPLGSQSIRQINSIMDTSNVKEKISEDPNERRILKIALQMELWMIFGGELLLSPTKEGEINLRMKMPLQP